MDSNALLVLVLSHLYFKKKKPLQLKKSREVWVREWLQKRKEKGCTENLVKELHLQMPALFTNFLRLSKDNFELLLGFVAPMIARNDTVLREAISARERLMITMRYLATGETFKSLSYMFRVSQPCISSQNSHCPTTSPVFCSSTMLFYYCKTICKCQKKR